MQLTAMLLGLDQPEAESFYASTPMPALRLFAGPAAARHIQLNGLRPQDIGAIPGAAGGPKGLILGPLDRFQSSSTKCGSVVRGMTAVSCWLPSSRRARARRL